VIENSSTSIDIDLECIGEKYLCVNCNTKFRGAGKKVRCPTCESSQIIKDPD
jgi:DNA-directed RNA polymerase subunit RPC12/RpoP